MSNAGSALKDLKKQRRKRRRENS